jgi:hypothetical protein
MDQHNAIRVEDLIRDPEVADPQAEELIVRPLDRLHKLPRRPRIAAETIDGSLEALAVWSGGTLECSRS